MITEPLDILFRFCLDELQERVVARVLRKRKEKRNNEQNNIFSEGKTHLSTTEHKILPYKDYMVVTVLSTVQPPRVRE